MLLRKFGLCTFAVGLFAAASMVASGGLVRPAEAGSLNKALGVGLAIGAGALLLNELNKQDKAKKKAKKKTQTTKKKWKKKTTTVNSGQSRAEVRAIQAALNDWGFDAGSVDGSMGRRTRSAIRSFQYAQGYRETGKLTRDQKAVLLDGPIYSQNDNNDGDNTNDGRQGNQNQPANQEKLGLVSLMNDLPPELVKLCSVPFNVISCFDLVTLSADQERISLEAIIADEFVEMNFDRLALQKGIYQGKVGNRDCELQIYDKPEFSKDDNNYVYGFLGFQECEGIYLSILVPKSASERTKAIENDANQQSMDFVTSEMRNSNSGLHAGLQ